jgi:ubiquitin carboxyl-terminal hydrolase 34
LYRRLTLEQVDILWNCLVNDVECADCLFSWLLSHAKSTDQHALGIDTLKYLYIEKMPTLNPETLSLMGLSLYQQLISLARMALGQVNIDTRDQNYPHVLAMDHLWKIALKANNTGPYYK